MENQTKAAPVARQGLLVGTVLSVLKNNRLLVMFGASSGTEQIVCNNPQKLAVEAGKLVIFNESIGRRAYKLDETGARIPKADGTGFELQDVDPYLQRNLQGVYNSEAEVLNVLRTGSNLSARIKASLEASNEIAAIEAKIEAKAQYADLFKKYNVASKEELLKHLVL